MQQVATSLAVLLNLEISLPLLVTGLNHVKNLLIKLVAYDAEIVVTRLFSTYRNLILPETGFRFLFLTVTRLRNHNTTEDCNVDL